MAKILGFDTNQPVIAYASQLYDKGYRFGARYLRRGAAWESNLKKSEAAAMSQAGLHIISVFQHRSNSPSEFTVHNAQIDAGAALARARELGQPKTSAIYFAVDTDITASSVGVMMAYARAFSEIVKEAGYGVGVYGDQQALEGCLQADNGLFGDVADHGWATNAWGWQRAKPEFIDILQTSTPFTVLPGLQIDNDEADGITSAGMWKLAA